LFKENNTRAKMDIFPPLIVRPFCGWVPRDPIALSLGAVEKKLRTRLAALAQFPKMTIGVACAGYTLDLHTIGFGTKVENPAFDQPSVSLVWPCKELV
jgi:hypothetical protein